MRAFHLIYTSEAKLRIRQLHPVLKSLIRLALDSLQADPWAGKALQKELTGLRSLRVKHFRVLYRVAEEEKQIEILTLGARKTIYEDFALKSNLASR
ncbi:MAG: type II toxin-antitoxin system RelE/ParE family toxin [Deltaproteobacteria bacterium]|nr:type II toxin-antitoxin system RelE/ParE family toxin [Deltaproteobacteria bacterium]